jgi:hypothetical protein
MDTHTSIVLLTIAVCLLTVVIVAILVLAIVLLIKIAKLVRNVNHISDNVVEITSWMTPTRLIGTLFKIIKRN